jgi:hypothetical protein
VLAVCVVDYRQGVSTRARHELCSFTMSAERDLSQCYISRDAYFKCQGTETRLGVRRGSMCLLSPSRCSMASWLALTIAEAAAVDAEKRVGAGETSVGQSAPDKAQCLEERASYQTICPASWRKYWDDRRKRGLPIRSIG